MDGKECSIENDLIFVVVAVCCCVYFSESARLVGAPHPCSNDFAFKCSLVGHYSDSICFIKCCSRSMVFSHVDRLSSVVFVKYPLSAHSYLKQSTWATIIYPFGNIVTRSGHSNARACRHQMQPFQLSLLPIRFFFQISIAKVEKAINVNAWERSNRNCRRCERRKQSSGTDFRICRLSQTAMCVVLFFLE